MISEGNKKTWVLISNIRSAKDYVDFTHLDHEHILRVKLEGLI